MKEYARIVYTEAVDHIDRHIGEHLQVGNIAKAIHVSESRLQRSFRLCAGCSVHAYLLAARLRKAKALLQEGAQVGEAAKSCGFPNRNHFSYCFKKEFGINPSQVKKMP